MSFSDLELVKDFFPKEIVDALMTIIKEYEGNLNPENRAPGGREEIDLFKLYGPTPDAPNGTSIIKDIIEFVEQSDVVDLYQKRDYFGYKKSKKCILVGAFLWIDPKDFSIPLHRDPSDGWNGLCHPWDIQIQIYLNNKRNPGTMFFDDSSIKKLKNYDQYVWKPGVPKFNYLYNVDKVKYNEGGDPDPGGGTVIWYMDPSEIPAIPHEGVGGFSPQFDYQVDENNLPPFIKESKYGYNRGYILYTSTRMSHCVPKILDSVGDRVSIQLQFHPTNPASGYDDPHKFT